jgi:glycosyltransferase involved in cell wall biosynthesis
VVINAKDEEHLVGRAIRSVVEQRDEWEPGEVEILVVDDHSTDRTAEVAASFAGVRVLTTDEPGIVHALNAGFRAASAPLIAHLDADDHYRPGALRALVTALEEAPELSVVAGGSDEYRADGTLIRQNRPLPSTEHLRVSIMAGCPFSHSAVCVRRESFDAVGAYREVIPGVMAAEDYDLWERMLTAGHEMRGLPTIIADRLIRPKSFTARAFGDQHAASANVRRRAISHLAAELDDVHRLIALGRALSAPTSGEPLRSRYQHDLVRIGLTLGSRREWRRAARCTRAAVALGPVSAATSTIRRTRSNIVERRARDLPVHHAVSRRAFDARRSAQRGLFDGRSA